MEYKTLKEVREYVEDLIKTYGEEAKIYDNTNVDDSYASLDLCVIREETDIEFETRLRREQEAARKKEEAEALEYKRLKAKYGST